MHGVSILLLKNEFSRFRVLREMPFKEEIYGSIPDSSLDKSEIN